MSKYDNEQAIDINLSFPLQLHFWEVQRFNLEILRVSRFKFEIFITFPNMKALILGKALQDLDLVGLRVFRHCQDLNLDKSMLDGKYLTSLTTQPPQSQPCLTYEPVIAQKSFPRKVTRSQRFPPYPLSLFLISSSYTRTILNISVSQIT